LPPANAEKAGRNLMIKMGAKLSALLLVLAASGAVQGQEFKLYDYNAQVHGFVQQGFIYTNNNNYLTMDTSSGSFAMTDAGLNMSSNLTDKVHVGAQAYVRNIGQLREGHPTLDWAVVDYNSENGWAFEAVRSRPPWGFLTTLRTWNFCTPGRCCRNRSTRWTGGPQPFRTWAQTSMDGFLCTRRAAWTTPVISG
jgi:hypothetical protein